MALTTLASYRLTSCISLILARGSVLDFQGSSSKSGQQPTTAAPPEKATATAAAAAIVNAANPGCLGGGGVDGAITTAGGPNLANDRRNLPLIEIDTDGYGPEYVRCPTGSAVITGPNNYGDLLVPYVIHAVGPNYWDYCGNDSSDDDEDIIMDDEGNNKDEDKNNNNNKKDAGILKAHELLRSAYQTSLDLAFENKIPEIAFSLLSAGVFRGPLPRKTILRNAVLAIDSWAKKKDDKEEIDGGKDGQSTDKDGNINADDCNTNNNKKKMMKMEVTLCAFNAKECETLKRICDEQFSTAAAAAAATVPAPATSTPTTKPDNAEESKEADGEGPLSENKKRTRSKDDNNNNNPKDDEL